MSLVAVALGLVVGVVIGGLGGGGGVLTVPALVMVLGQSGQDATTGSVVIVGITSAVGVLVRLRSGCVRWRTGLALGAVGIPATMLGTVLNRSVAEPVLLLAFAGLTLLAAAALLLDSRGDRTGPPLPPRALGTAAAAVRIVGCGAAVGFLTGFLGVGGGFLAVPALVLVLRMPLPQATGTSLLVIVLNSLSALASRSGALPHLDWPVVGAFTLAAAVSAVLATRVAHRLEGTVLTRAFAVMLLAVGLSVGAANLLA